MTRSLAGFAEAALGLVYPEACQFCGLHRATARDGYVCPTCWTKEGGVRFIRPPFCERCGLPFEGDITNSFECSNCREMELHFSRARAAVEARGLVLDAIHRYKYQRALWVEPFLGELLRVAASEDLRSGGWNLLIPVPLHPAREREREFNQSARLGGALARLTGLKLRSDLLKRVVPTRTQTLLSRRERTENMRHAFAPACGERLDGARVVLIDDVFTTGATTSACAQVLRELGAEEVCVWTVARGL